jgi:hypothetical protein
MTANATGEIVVAILRVILDLIDRAFRGDEAAQAQILGMLPEGPLKITVAANLAAEQAREHFRAR